MNALFLFVCMVELDYFCYTEIAEISKQFLSIFGF